MADDSKSPPPTKRARLDFSSEITVLVGEAEKRYMIHEGIITSHSSFFRAACSGHFKEAKEKVVRLPTVSPQTFEHYLQYVYTGDVTFLEAQTEGEDTVCTNFERVVGLYVFGDRFEDRKLRNDAIDSLEQVRQQTHSLINPLAIRTAYSNTTEASMLRKYIVDVYASYHPQHKASAEWLRHGQEVLPNGFIFDLLCRTAGASNDPVLPPKNKTKCAYHEHDEQTPQCT